MYGCLLYLSVYIHLSITLYLPLYLVLFLFCLSSCPPSLYPFIYLPDRRHREAPFCVALVAVCREAQEKRRRREDIRFFPVDSSSMSRKRSEPPRGCSAGKREEEKNSLSLDDLLRLKEKEATHEPKHRPLSLSLFIRSSFFLSVFNQTKTARAFSDVHARPPWRNLFACAASRATWTPLSVHSISTDTKISIRFFVRSLSLPVSP